MAFTNNSDEVQAMCGREKGALFASTTTPVLSWVDRSVAVQFRKEIGGYEFLVESKRKGLPYLGPTQRTAIVGR